MQQMIVSGILYAVWILLPLIVFFGLRALRATRENVVGATMLAAAFAIPGYIGLICLTTGMVWPPDIFFAPNGSRLSAAVPGYKVEYAQKWGQDFYETYYEVTREDGLKAYLEIDGDDNKCWTFENRQVGSRIYFLCDEKAPGEQTSYLDTEKQVLYAAGPASCTRSLDEMVFRDYPSNPLLGQGITDEVFRSVRCEPRVIWSNS